MKIGGHFTTIKTTLPVNTRIKELEKRVETLSATPPSDTDKIREGAMCIHTFH